MILTLPPIFANLVLAFPNGLIPQAPFHTNSLCVYSPAPPSPLSSSDRTSPSDSTFAEKQPPPSPSPGPIAQTRVITRVVEQRLSNLAQGLLTLGTMTGPFLIVLHLIPQGVLAGLFFIMGLQALASNGITLKMLFLARDRGLTPPSSSEPLASIPRSRRFFAIGAFVALQLIGFGATFAITQTIAAIGFPIIILALIPVRTFLLPRYWKAEHLAVLDAPTASPFVYESVGGAYGVEEAKEQQDEIRRERTRGSTDGGNAEGRGAAEAKEMSGGAGRSLAIERGKRQSSNDGNGVVR